MMIDGEPGGYGDIFGVRVTTAAADADVMMLPVFYCIAFTATSALIEHKLSHHHFGRLRSSYSFARDCWRERETV